MPEKSKVEDIVKELDTSGDGVLSKVNPTCAQSSARPMVYIPTQRLTPHPQDEIKVLFSNLLRIHVNRIPEDHPEVFFSSSLRISSISRS